MAEIGDVEHPSPSELRQQLGEIENKVSNLKGNKKSFSPQKKSVHN